MATLHTSAIAHGYLYPNQTANGNLYADTYCDANRQYAYPITYDRGKYAHAIADNTHHHTYTDAHQPAR
jgi:hypothetical protein